MTSGGRSFQIACWGLILTLATVHHALPGPEEQVSAVTAARRQLERLNGLIGEWRGIGQIRRGSNQGAWKQTSEFVWDFSQESPAIRYVVADGRLAREARITWDATLNCYVCTLQHPDGRETVCRGNWEDIRLVLTSEPDGEQQRLRLTITPLNDKRTLVLHETAMGAGAFGRVAEVGYTREGTRLALPGNVGRECVVTGGAGTMEVTYKGETYYVCCTGCRQAFDDDPAGVIADFKARLKKRLESR